MTRKKARLPAATPSRSSVRSPLKFCLYVAGQTPRSLAAIANLQRICRDHFPGRSSIEVIDLMANPALARRDQIVALPTLVRRLPRPMRVVIGDLSNADKVLEGLEVPSIPGALTLVMSRIHDRRGTVMASQLSGSRTVGPSIGEEGHDPPETWEVQAGQNGRQAPDAAGTVRGDLGRHPRRRGRRPGRRRAGRRSDLHLGRCRSGLSGF